LFRSGWGLKKASGERDEVQVVRGGESDEEEAAGFAKSDENLWVDPVNLLEDSEPETRTINSV
jgi:hypothetical protein